MLAEEIPPPQVERFKQKLDTFYDNMRLWGMVNEKLAEEIANQSTELGRPQTKESVVRGALEGFAGWQATCVGATPDTSKMTDFGLLSLAIMLTRYKCSR